MAVLPTISVINWNNCLKRNYIAWKSANQQSLTARRHHLVELRQVICSAVEIDKLSDKYLVFLQVPGPASAAVTEDCDDMFMRAASAGMCGVITFSD